MNNFVIFDDSTKIDENGIVLQYGRARVEKLLFYDLNLIVGVGSTKPLDQDLFITKTLGIGREGNRFNTNDSAGLSFFLPNDMDTSSPLYFTICYISNSTAAAQTDFQLIMEHQCVMEGDTIYLTTGAAPVSNPSTKSTTFQLPVNQTNGQNMVIEKFALFFNDCKSRDLNQKIRDIIFLNITRPNDGNSNQLVLLQVSSFYTQFIGGSTFK